MENCWALGLSFGRALANWQHSGAVRLRLEGAGVCDTGPVETRHSGLFCMLLGDLLGDSCHLVIAKQGLERVKNIRLGVDLEVNFHLGVQG